MFKPKKEIKYQKKHEPFLFYYLIGRFIAARIRTVLDWFQS